MYYECPSTNETLGRDSGNFSPSLHTNRIIAPSMTNSSPAELGGSYAARGAYEIKFLIDHAKSLVVRQWARDHLQLDPHVSAEVGDGNLVNSLYLDTANFDVFHREDGFRQRKYRLRRYGSESLVWMELKRKEQGRVRKRRTSIADAELSSKLTATPSDDWEGTWFQRRLERQGLRPVCEVTYRRFACVGSSPFGPVRLTIDSHLRCELASGWNVPSQPLTTKDLLGLQQILELKFRETMPTSFRDLIRDQRLHETTFSKYRESVEACVPLNQLIGQS